MNRFFRFLLSKLRSEEIAGECPNLGSLLIRYDVLKLRGRGIYLHHLLRSDAGRELLHDHPWPFISIILTGGYTEITPDGRRFYGPGSVLFRRAIWSHRLEMNKPCWTLVFRGRRCRAWGFITQQHDWIFWKDYDYKRDLCPED